MSVFWLKTPFGEMAQGDEKPIYLNLTLSGEMKPSDIPLSGEVDLEALKKDDSDPLEIVVEIPAGKSTRGWEYKPSSLQDIVKHVQEKTLNGFLGHQKPKDVGNKFEDPVTHWVGAKWENNKAYFRGVIDSSAKDLKRWIRNKRIKQVSIFGYPKLQKVSGETHVVGYNPLSIDWTPLDRSGMPTSIVAIGEMKELIDMMDEIVGEVDDKTKTKGGIHDMTWKELVEKLKQMLASGDVTVAQVISALGLDTKKIAGEMDGDWLKEVNTNSQTLEKLNGILGISGEMDITEVAKSAVDALNEKQSSERNKVIEEVVKEKVTGEMAQGLVLRMLKVEDGSTKEKIAGEVDQLLKDELVKNAISQYHTDKPVIKGKGDKGNQSQFTRTRSNSI